MIVLGLVLLVLAVGLGVVVVVSNPAMSTLSLFAAQVPVTPGGVFLTGAGAMLVALLGMLLVQRGIVRSRRRRRQRKNLPPPVQSSLTPPAAQTRAGRPPGPAASAPSPAATPARSANSSVPPSRPVPDHEDAQPGTKTSTPAERAALLAETDQLTRDDPPR